MNPLKKAKFLTSVAQIRQLHLDHGAEVAFVGRSNCGKSSLLNALTEQKKLAYVSKTPGRTQMINFFELGDHSYRLVDLPGYGFAKVSAAVTTYWQQLISQYLKDRLSLKGIVFINDIRHPLKENDHCMLNWCQQKAVPVLLVLSKSDKLSYGQARLTQQKITQIVQSLKTTMSVYLASSQKKSGLDEIRTWIHQRLTGNVTD